MSRPRTDANDPQVQARYAAFLQGLQQFDEVAEAEAQRARTQGFEPRGMEEEMLPRKSPAAVISRARAASGHATAAPPSERDELPPFQLIEWHSVPSEGGPIAGYRISEDQSGGSGDQSKARQDW